MIGNFLAISVKLKRNGISFSFPAVNQHTRILQNCLFFLFYCLKSFVKDFSPMAFPKWWNENVAFSFPSSFMFDLCTLLPVFS